MDQLTTLQSRFQQDLQPYHQMGEGKVGLLEVIGDGGELLHLKEQNGRITYAGEDEKPSNIFRCTSDTFLSVLTGEEDLRQAITKGHFVIASGSTGSIDLVEMEKWSKAFERLRSLLNRYVGGRL